MAEAVLAEAARHRLDEPERSGGVERVEDAVAIQRRRALERREVKRAPDDRGELEGGELVLVERLEAPADRLAHALGQRQLLGRVVEPALGQQQREHLAREERVALGGARARRRRGPAVGGAPLVSSMSRPTSARDSPPSTRRRPERTMFCSASCASAVRSGTRSCIVTTSSTAASRSIRDTKSSAISDPSSTACRSSMRITTGPSALRTRSSATSASNSAKRAASESSSTSAHGLGAGSRSASSGARRSSWSAAAPSSRRSSLPVEILRQAANDLDPRPVRRARRGPSRASRSRARPRRRRARRAPRPGGSCRRRDRRVRDARRRDRRRRPRTRR